MPNTTDARHQEALRLRRTGMSYSAIARELGYGPYPSAARYAVMSAMRNEVSATATTTRQFGVEIEFYGITPQTAIAALAQVGITASWEGYTHAVMADWKIVRDGSVTGTGTGQGNGIELVSPILKGEQGLQDLAKALDALHSAGAKVNTTCGIHVHVDTNGMNGMQRKNFFNSYVLNQDIFDSLVSKSRRNNRNYTCRYGSSERADYANALESGDVNRYNRYRTVNITSYAKYGTLEFRQHQGSLSGKKVVAWVKLLLALASKAQASTVADETVYNSLAELLEAVNLEPATKNFLLRRQSVLNRERVAA
jgi:Putative amidoligase enzyme